MFVRIIILCTRIILQYTVPQAKVVSSSANQHPYPGSLDSTGDGGEGRGDEGVTMVRGRGRGGGGGRGRRESWEIGEEDEEEGEFGECLVNQEDII